MGVAKEEQVGFRVTPGERKAVEELVRRRHEETGDDSASGWFRALLRREAKGAGVAIEETTVQQAPKKGKAKR
jgi:hypothetical protein